MILNASIYIIFVQINALNSSLQLGTYAALINVPSLCHSTYFTEYRFECSLYMRESKIVTIVTALSVNLSHVRDPLSRL